MMRVWGFLGGFGWRDGFVFVAGAGAVTGRPYETMLNLTVLVFLLPVLTAVPSSTAPVAAAATETDSASSTATPPLPAARPPITTVAPSAAAA